MNRKNTLLKIAMLTFAVIFSIALTVAASAEGGAAAAQGGIAVNDENFPDPAFREYILANINTSEGDLGEGEEILTETEIAEVYYIEIWYDDITSLKGIEHFTALEGLFCYGNELTELDLTGNTSLIDLSCAYNKLTSLKLPESLQNLDASNNRLTELDLASLPSLYYVSLDYNQFTSIDLSGNKMLSYLSIDGNRLTSLDMTGVGSETEQGNFYSVTAENNIHKIELTDNTFDLAGMPEGFDLTKVRSFGNATLEGSVITVTDPESRISYEYYIGTSYYEEEYVTFYLTDKDPIISGFEFKTDDPDFFLPIAGESTYRDSEEYFDAFSRGTDFELIDAYWCDMTNGDPEGEFFTDLYEEGYSFKGDTVYQLCLDFKTDGYFTFSEENLSNYQVNGLSPAEIFFYDSESFGLAYNMPVTAALALTEIGEIELTVSEEILPDPVAGELAFRDEEAIRAVFEGTDIVYGTYYWGDGSFEEIDDFYSSYDGYYYGYDSFPIFLENSTYSFILRLKAASGYTFGEGFSIKLNGQLPAKLEIDRVTEDVRVCWSFETGEEPVIDESERYISSVDFSFSDADFPPPSPKELLTRDFSVIDRLCDGENFEIYEAVWGYVYETAGSLNYIEYPITNKGERFLENTRYYLSLYLIAKPGYAFDVSEAVAEDFLLNGAPTSSRLNTQGSTAYEGQPFLVYEEGRVLSLHFEYGITGEHSCLFSIDAADGTHHYRECLCGLVLESSREEHSGGSATCTAFAICESCDKPYGNKAEHKGGSASCTAEAVCEVCNNPYGTSLGHKYTINGQDKNAHWKRCETCSAVTDREEHGYIDDICSVCSYEREAPPIDNTPKDPTPESTDNTVSPKEDNEGITGAQIAAIAVGSASGLGGGGFALYWFLIRRRRLGK